MSRSGRSRNRIFLTVCLVAVCLFVLLFCRTGSFQSRHVLAVYTVLDGSKDDNRNHPHQWLSELVESKDLHTVQISAETITSPHGHHPETAVERDEHIQLKSVSVAFYEHFRGKWLYAKIFQPFQGSVTCNYSADLIAKKKMIYKAEDIKQYDVVIFIQDVSRRIAKPSEWQKLSELRDRFAPDQRWLYATREGTAKLHRILPTSDVPLLFHWSLTYHSKSTFTVPYGYFFEPSSHAEHAEKIDNLASTKEYLIAWMAALDPPQKQHYWRREQFAQNLSLYLDVHIYGENRGRQCPWNTDECRRLISKYKFYLALENSCCREYITEKFWRTLTWNVVPVVVGPPKEDYLRLAPPHSFIYADDFDSMEDLANFLKVVDSNDTLYNGYFEWKKKFVAVNNFPDRNEYRSNTTIPPPTFAYSCESVCTVADKFVGEQAKTEPRLNSTAFFDPRSSWWDGSCGSCGNKPWLRGF